MIFSSTTSNTYDPDEETEGEAGPMFDLGEKAPEADESEDEAVAIGIPTDDLAEAEEDKEEEESDSESSLLEEDTEEMDFDSFDDKDEM